MLSNFCPQFVPWGFQGFCCHSSNPQEQRKESALTSCLFINSDPVTQIWKSTTLKYLPEPSDYVFQANQLIHKWPYTAHMESHLFKKNVNLFFNKAISMSMHALYRRWNWSLVISFYEYTTVKRAKLKAKKKKKKKRQMNYAITTLTFIPFSKL